MHIIVDTQPYMCMDKYLQIVIHKYKGRYMKEYKLL